MKLLSNTTLNRSILRKIGKNTKKRRKILTNDDKPRILNPVDDQPTRPSARLGREALGDGYFRFNLPETADPAAVASILQEGRETFDDLTASKSIKATEGE
jgi:hypothetical protein